MKILFAVSNENVSDAIVKSYQKNYNDTITYKNVFYFNAIIKEIQRDKQYDRIIISEDLEPFANNNYNAIDKFIYERLEAISSEIKDFSDKRIPIILICTDRRTKSSAMIKKIFNIDIYDAVIGSDRKIENVCKLIKEPRTKVDARQYYKIDNEEEDGDSAGEDISEEEVQNIVNYYKKLGKNEERYADSFNNIATQYTDAQLKIIIRYLPINVKAVLEAECAKYQELVTFDNPETVRETKEKEKLKRRKQIEREEEEERIREKLAQNKKKEEAEKRKKQNEYIPNNSGKELRQEVKTNSKTTTGIGILDDKINKPAMQGKVVIPNAIDTKQARKVLSDEEMNVRKATKKVNEKSNVLDNKPIKEEKIVENTPQQKVVEEKKEIKNVAKLPGFDDIETDNIEVNFSNVDTKKDVQVKEAIQKDTIQKEEKAENPLNIEKTSDEKAIPQINDVEKAPAKRGRPRKTPLPEENIPKPAGKRGRPRKTPLPEEEAIQKPKGKRGRPRKTPLPEENIDETIESNNIVDTKAKMPEVENENITSTFSSFDAFEVPEGKTEDTTSSAILPGLDEEFENIEMVNKESVTEQETTTNMIDDAFTNSDLSDNIEDNSIESETNLQEEETTTLPGMLDIDFEEEQESNVGSLNLEDEIEQENNVSGLNLEDEIEQESNVSSLNLEDEIEQEENLNEFENISNDDINNNVTTSLPGFEDLDDMLSGNNESQEESTLPGFEDEISSNIASATSYRESDKERKESIKKLEENRVYSTGTLENVLAPDKKIVAFIGTSKNGTSFIVNNLASLFSSIGIKTAILDMTKNRNSYYIYTNNDERLRQISYSAIDKLENGIAEGIKADRNLDVFTAVPNEEKDFSNAEAILTTLIKNESLVLIDCDYDTPLGYFANAQEIYLVQSMDILTIQPLTAFLRELKANGILNQEKLRVVINKEIKVRGLTSKTVIGGMSFYNNPSMSYMTELFNKDKIKACTLPFEDAIYSKYLETLVNCNISISGYSKNFMNSLKILGNMVYPLLSKQSYVKNGPDYGRSNFSTEMNNTLNQMRKKY